MCCAFCSTPTTGYNFDKAGYIPIELVFFNENSVPSLKAQWTGPSSGVMTVSPLLRYATETECPQLHCSLPNHMIGLVAAELTARQLRHCAEIRLNAGH